MKICQACRIVSFDLPEKVSKDVNYVFKEFIGDIKIFNIHDNHYICTKCDEDVKNIMSIVDTPLYCCPIKGCHREIYMENY